jgi:hypothetical protein
MKDIKTAIEAMSELQNKYRYIPIKVKMNENWIKEQIEKGEILEGTTKPYQFMGLPVVIDNTISTVEFILPKECDI